MTVADAIDSGPVTYFDSRFSRDAIKLLPGQYYVASSDKLIVTTLGSCIAACLYDPVLEIGGMNHFMLPDTTQPVTDPGCIATKYGVHAMEVLINDLLKLGADKRRLVAKVFGGAYMLPGLSTQDIGMVNADFVIHFLKTEGIRLVASALLNTYARKVYFLPALGNVYMKRIREFNNSTLLDREQHHRLIINREPVNTSPQQAGDPLWQ